MLDFLKNLLYSDYANNKTTKNKGLQMKNTTYKLQGRLGLVIFGGLASLMVAFTLTPAFASIVASIQNSLNTAKTGTLTMEEKSGAHTCNSFDGSGSTTNTATCSSINKYGGGVLLPGAAPTKTDISLKNTGTIAAKTFSLNPSSCSQSAVGGTSFSGTAGNLCEKVKVKIVSGSKTIYDGTAAALTSPINLLEKLTKTSIEPQESVPISVSVQLDAGVDSTYQSLQISQPLTWQFGA